MELRQHQTSFLSCFKEQVDYGTMVIINIVIHGELYSFNMENIEIPR